ncbi:MAG: DNA-binding protein WhiA [Evtepia sp.]|jgi:DNA-binding protein WhiA|nr:DNA-binding protein WhiA [Evtepia sp.]
MSFSGDTKAELCRIRIQRSCCARAEACGVLLYCNHFSAQAIKIVTESTDFAKRLPILFRKAFQIDFDQKMASDATGGKQTFLITDSEKLLHIWEICGGSIGGGIAHHINFAFLEDEHCQLSFLRGAFLSAGSVTAPQKGYHLELVTSHYYVNRELIALILDLGYTPKETTRKSNYVTYFKQSESIEDFLTAIGAPVSAMAIMSAKVEKNLRNGINRRVNCDAANVDKTVDAAQEQLAAIRILTTNGTMESLSDKFQEAARLRQENPEFSLSELAALCEPPVTKSCLNHRLRKLIALSKEISE